MTDLWSFGLPQNMRKALWPFIFKNKLQITPTIYRVNKEKAQRDIAFLEQIDETDEDVSHDQSAFCMIKNDQ